MKKALQMVLAVSLMAVSSFAAATNYTLWVNGRTGGVSGSGGGSCCNPSDWFCNDLTLGTAANEGGSLKWSYHSVSFRDDAESYNHYANGNWGGIVGVVRSAVVNSAL